MNTIISEWKPLEPIKYKKLWFELDLDWQIGFTITIFISKEAEANSIMISIMCFNIYMYWWTKKAMENTDE